MREQLVDGVNALIVSAEAEAIAGAIASLLENDDRCEAFCGALKNEDFSSEKFLQEYERTVFCEDTKWAK
jgi:glycosyltransferase involved in cell wall biosynthesis